MARRFAASTTDYLSWPASDTNWALPGNFAISFWCRPLATQSSPRPLSRWRNDADRQWVFHAASMVPRFDVLDNAGGGRTADAPGPMRVGVWSHIWGQVTTGGGGSVQAWHNAVAGAGVAITNALDSSAVVTTRVGSCHDGDGDEFIGDVRDIALWHDALWPWEIKAVYDGHPPHTIRAGSFKGHWPLATDLLDLKGAAAAATQTGTVHLVPTDTVAPSLLDQVLLPAFTPRAAVIM